MQKILVSSTKEYHEAKTYLNSQTCPLVMDTETDGVEVRKNQMVGIGLAAGDKAFYMPFRHKEGTNLPERLVGDVCSNILRPDREQWGYHYGFDVKMMAKEGMVPPKKIKDGMLRAYMLNENEESFKMEAICQKYIDEGAGESEDKLVELLLERFGGSAKKAKGNLHRLPAYLVADYGTQDLISTRDLIEFQGDHLKTWKLDDLADDFENFQLAICDMEMRGCVLDLPLIHQNMEKAEPIYLGLEADLQEAAGYALNPRSFKQLQALMEVDSTSKDVLEPLAEGGGPKADLARKILDYRAWYRVNGTYYSKFISLQHNGRLHPNLSLTRTTSTRLSCTGPNMQAIPRETEEGSAYADIKHTIVAPEGYHLYELDLAQAEICVFGHYSKDPFTLEVLESGQSMHDLVAARLNVPRAVAKGLNFSVQYGMGAEKFAEKFGWSYPDAVRYLRGYHQLRPGIKRLSRTLKNQAEADGYIRLYTGRVRHFNSKRAPPKDAMNNKIQGAVAEMLRIACTRIHQEVPRFLPILSVHDSILGYVKDGEEREVIPQAVAIMEDQPWCSVPIKTDVKRGMSWGGAVEWNC